MIVLCPKCESPAFPWWRKLLGLAVTASCRACSTRVGVARSAALVAFVPFAVALIVASAIPHGIVTEAAISLAGFAIMSGIYLRVPLIVRRRQPPSAET
jgi:hypothetical protein